MKGLNGAIPTRPKKSNESQSKINIYKEIKRTREHNSHEKNHYILIAIFVVPPILFFNVHLVYNPRLLRWMFETG